MQILQQLEDAEEAEREANRELLTRPDPLVDLVHPLPYASPDRNPFEQNLPEQSQTSIFTDKLVAELLHPIPAISKLAEQSPVLECTGHVPGGREKFDDCCLNKDCILCSAKIATAFMHMPFNERKKSIDRLKGQYASKFHSRIDQIMVTEYLECERARIFADFTLALAASDDESIVRTICRSLQWRTSGKGGVRS